jgi:hypothetical protein
MLRHLIAGVFAVSCFTSWVQADPVQYAGNGSYFELIPFVGTWFEAEADAQAMSYLGRTGHLATITTEEENQFVLDNFTPQLVDLGMFMGAGDFDEEGVWRWLTGPEAGMLLSDGYTFWGSNEPVNWMGIEHYMVFDAEGGSGLPEWDDKPIDYAQHYLVEYSVPEPASVGLLAIGGFALLRGYGLRRRAHHRA